MLLALALGGVGAWGCGDGTAPVPVDEGEPATAGAPPTAVEWIVLPQSILQPQPVATAKLMRVAPQHLQAVQQGLAQRLSRSSEGLEMHVTQDGRRSMKLEGRFGHVLIANQDETGKTQVQCAGSQEEVAKALGN